MAISDTLQAMNQAVEDSKTAIATKGGSVGDTGLAGLATEIASIPSGGADPAFFGCDEGVAEMSYLENIMPEILTINYGGVNSTWL